jgi:hypothetical protein
MEVTIQDLIKGWEELAERYRRKADNMEGYAYEHLIASASTLDICADQLRRHISQTVGE